MRIFERSLWLGKQCIRQQHLCSSASAWCRPCQDSSTCSALSTCAAGDSCATSQHIDDQCSQATQTAPSSNEPSGHCQSCSSSSDTLRRGSAPAPQRSPGACHGHWGATAAQWAGSRSNIDLFSPHDGSICAPSGCSSISSSSSTRHFCSGSSCQDNAARGSSTGTSSSSSSGERVGSGSMLPRHIILVRHASDIRVNLDRCAHGCCLCCTAA